MVGTPVAGRTEVESEQLVGSLVNTLALGAHDYLMDQLHKQAPGTRVAGE